MPEMLLLGLCSHRTLTGMSRIAQILKPDIIIDRKGEGSEKDYDGIIAHNHFGDPFNGRLPRILYLASYNTASVATKPANVKLVKNHPPTEIWVNQEMGRQLLEKVGLKARTMYRPNKLEIPAKCPKPPKNRGILWHFHHSDFRMPPNVEKKIANAMRELSDVKIRIINADRGGNKWKPKGKGLDHVDADGFLNLRKEMPNWHGIVRIYQAPQNLDHGRSTFQAFAYGRWYICRKSREPFVTSVDTIADVVPMVRELIDNPDTEAAQARWEYARSQFAEDILHDKWVAAVKRVIN